MPKKSKVVKSPDSDPISDSRPGASPAQASQYLLFALSQLAGENGHHKFENICFQLARRRIYSNIIPATGPVSAGGDQGADFETYRTGEVTPMVLKTAFFANVAHEKVVFACSIERNVQRKIAEDLKAAAIFPEKVERLVFLSNWDVPVGKRHRLQKLASETYGLTLEVFDARAISSFLADPELFWIAQEFLSVPSDFVLSLPRSSHQWYEKLLSKEITPSQLMTRDFFSLKDVHISLGLHDGDLHIEDIPDNEKVSMSVLLPRGSSENNQTSDSSAIAQAVAATALMMVSALSHEQFMEAYKRRLKAGLLAKLTPYTGYDRLFREFYGEEDFVQHYAHTLPIKLPRGMTIMRTSADLSGPSGIHREYNRRDSERVIHRRYKLSAGQLKYTLPTLLKDSLFLDAVRELHQEGWKDWHILQATASIRLNYVIGTMASSGSQVDELKRIGKSLFGRDEQESDPIPPTKMFTGSELRRALKMTQVSTLNGLGFHCWQRTPNFDAINRFLQRFNYWTDDVVHDKIFPD